MFRFVVIQLCPTLALVSGFLIRSLRMKSPLYTALPEFSQGHMGASYFLEALDLCASCIGRL